jgi:hypothetical protein
LTESRSKIAKITGIAKTAKIEGGGTLQQISADERGSGKS